MVVLITMESVGNLEEQALKRKERLKNLKRKLPNEETSTDDAKNEQIVLPKLVD